MLTIEDRTIKIHRGDEGTIIYDIFVSDTQHYTFQIGDKVKFTVFEKKGYDKRPVFQKEVIINEEKQEVEIIINSEDTLIGKSDNKPITYWYEISLNDVQTTNGYSSDDGPAEFIILPAKGGEN